MEDAAEETVDGMKRPRLVGMGGLAKPGPELAERIKLSLFTLQWWKKVLVLCFSHITFRLMSLSRSEPILRFVGLCQRFVR
jgi:hypothetical protein